MFGNENANPLKTSFNPSLVLFPRPLLDKCIGYDRQNQSDVDSLRLSLYASQSVFLKSVIFFTTLSN